MYYAYVIKSLHHEYFYKGHCQNIDLRLVQHNAGLTESIKSYVPFELVYFETFETRQDAIAREKYFKSAAGRKYLRNKLL